MMHAKVTIQITVVLQKLWEERDGHDALCAAALDCHSKQTSDEGDLPADDLDPFSWLFRTSRAKLYHKELSLLLNALTRSLLQISAQWPW